ncbi:putative NBD/HSP70 family sugar kinase [Labedella gwakjiensis]|uniref:Putative NBD/HSP70 family sugar kinase n=1 Tax=Labedella gwakjiensis TaxID=390269 RepID=A0A2P8GTU8_9MICO|nr:ROK family transcriptional regulator [Labedella gwakjiensis]PSL37393.1 putative NBD/HSP70 family sugar kinase [Labedella gwakjiensis]RUQ84712.1 ROK family transcriptional regulator [Labedella gwakjiensis]
MAQVTTEGLIPSARELAREILIHGPVSRAELGRRLDLSPASLTRLTKTLTDVGFVVEGEEVGDRSLGRPVRPLDVRLDLGVVVGVKLTGDAATVVATDLRARVLRQVERPLGDHAPDAVVALLRDLVEEVAEGERILAVGVALGGLVDDRGVVRHAPYLEWVDVPLRDLLAQPDGPRLVIENDLLALTRAEHWFGAGRGLRDFAVVTVGAGVGYGLVIDDRVVARRDSGVGLAGHIPLDPEGPVCAEGHVGCSTAMLTISGITEEVARRLGGPVTYAEVLSLAGDGDPEARAVVGASGVALGRLLALVANLTSVNDIVVSGEGIGLLDVVGDVVRSALDRDRDPLAAPVDLIADVSGFDEWARGAAASAIQSIVLDG